MMNTISFLCDRLQKNQHCWLVTGAAGFIGSHLVEFLLKNNQRVIGIDNFCTGFQENIDTVLHACTAEQRDNLSFHTLDVCELPDHLELLSGVDYILHQAAMGSVPRSIQTPLLTNHMNVTGTLAVFYAAVQAGVKHVVYASSSSVYGSSTHLPKREEVIGDVLSPYAASKRANELYADAFTSCYDVNLVGLRYFNVFGPRQNPHGPYAAVIPIWITALRDRTPLVLNGDGETSRDFTYVMNAVQANVLAALNAGACRGHVFNVACGQETSLKLLMDKLIQKMPSTYSPRIEKKEFRPGDVRHAYADIAKAQKMLGYEVCVSLDAGLQQTIQWYMRQSEGNNIKF